MSYNPNAIDNASAVLSTYVLFDISVSAVGLEFTVALVNAAVDGVDPPITVLFIVVFTIGAVKPDSETIPIFVPSIFKTISFTASNSKLVPDEMLLIPVPPTLKFPSIQRSPAIPTPPATFNDPVVADVELVSSVMLTEL